MGDHNTTMHNKCLILLCHNVIASHSSLSIAASWSHHNTSGDGAYWPHWCLLSHSPSLTGSLLTSETPRPTLTRMPGRGRLCWLGPASQPTTSSSSDAGHNCHPDTRGLSLVTRAQCWPLIGQWAPG